MLQFIAIGGSDRGVRLHSLCMSVFTELSNWQMEQGDVGNIQGPK